jgi:hypothetical protein
LVKVNVFLSTGFKVMVASSTIPAFLGTKLAVEAPAGAFALDRVISG